MRDKPSAMSSFDAPEKRVFLFLQGPHGPFFDQLARQLRRAGAETWRVGFNMGDQVFWRRKDRYIAFRDHANRWPARCAELTEQLNVTDLVIYGDARPVHAEAIAQARTLGLCIHCFEEGYLRPYWVTYEHGGANGYSRLMEISLDDLRATMAQQASDPHPPPCHWGDMREHVFFGALYHGLVLARNRGYPGFRPHRTLNVSQEFRLYLKRLVLMPFHAIGRWRATRAVKRGSFPYHLVLLQLEHDSSFQAHGPFESQDQFIKSVIEGFAAGAPKHHHLVFKCHPLEDGRAPLRRSLKRHAEAAGVWQRVHLLRGGKLAALLDHAVSAVTVNSTAGHQVLWRGLPLCTLGEAIYSKPELVSDQPLSEFFANPTRPDPVAYRMFRDFLLSTSQYPGSFYAAKGRRQLVRQVSDKMLGMRDPYAQLAPKSDAHRQQLRLVGT